MDNPTPAPQNAPQDHPVLAAFQNELVELCRKHGIGGMAGTVLIHSNPRRDNLNTPIHDTQVGVVYHADLCTAAYTNLVSLQHQATGALCALLANQGPPVSEN